MSVLSLKRLKGRIESYDANDPNIGNVRVCGDSMPYIFFLREGVSLPVKQFVDVVALVDTFPDNSIDVRCVIGIKARDGICYDIRNDFKLRMKDLTSEELGFFPDALKLLYG